MYLGAYNACLHDKPLGDALQVIADLGLTSAEINSGGFLPPVHLPIEQLRSSEDARQEYLGEFSSRGLTLTALNCNGNPLHPAAGFPHAKDLVESIEVAALLGVKRVITMSGTPAWTQLDQPRVEPAALVEPVPRRAGPPVGRGDPVLEGHPGPGRRRRREGRHRDAPRQHRLQPLDDAPARRGDQRDPRRRRDGPEPPLLAGHRPGARGRRPRRARLHRGGQGHGSTRPPRSTACSTTGSRGSRRASRATCRWVAARRSAAGRPTPRGTSSRSGAGTTRPTGPSSCARLAKIDPDMPVNIEHEDQELDQMEGLRFAAQTLIDAEKAL